MTSQQMLADIDAHFLDTSKMTGIDALSPAVRAAIETVNRGDFVPDGSIASAEGDFPLPIGQGQTISQPFIVALMTELIQPKPADRVLEIGTGSAYQAALLGQLVSEVFSLEIIASLAEQARQRLKQLAYTNVSVRCADGYEGWHEQAPFDSILVTAAIDEIPAELLAQLAEGGRLVLPLGKPGGDQQLVLVNKQSGGEITRRNVLPVRFVAFTRSK